MLIMRLVLQHQLWVNALIGRLTSTGCKTFSLAFIMQDVLFKGVLRQRCALPFAHWISHSIAGITPVYHRLATALGFEFGLPHRLTSDSAVAEPAFRTFGAAQAAEMLNYLKKFLDKIGVERTLLNQFREVLEEEYSPAL